MRLQSRWLARFAVLAVMCAGIALAAVPTSALATCVSILGSGSSLQGEQQSTWSTGWTPCNTGVKVTYMTSSSGKGLAEWGVGTSKITVSESPAGKLDGFIGTDDPPTLTELHEIELAGKTKALVVPVVSAPVDFIVHPPVACNVLGGDLSFPVLNSTLLDVWSLQLVTWGQFLLAVQKHLEELKTGLAFTFNTGKECHERDILREVRSDSSGTSFAFKQYLCQLLPTLWGDVTNASECNTKEYVLDKAVWPVPVDTEHGSKVLNEGSKGEAEAVANTEGSVGYVNAANAVSAGFGPYRDSLLRFWTTISDTTEPTTGTKANCPSSYTFATGVKAEAEANMWTSVHLASKSETSNYPLCTFTYDLGWRNYKEEPLNADYNSEGTQVGETASSFFKFMLGTSAGEGQEDLHEYYAKLPSSIITVATPLAEAVG